MSLGLAYRAFLPRAANATLGDARPQVARDVGDNVLAELELVGNESVALDNRAQLAVDVLACERGLRERDKKVGDLRVALVALARSRDDNDAPRGIREDDVNYLV